MQCPNCRLENPPSAERCDCGYDFEAGQKKRSYLTPRTRSSSKAPSRLKWIWPTIDDEESARKAIRQGISASIWVAAATAFIVILGMATNSKQADPNSQVGAIISAGPFAFIDALVFAIIGWRIHKNSLSAAVLGLIFYLLERIDMWTTTVGGKNPVVAFFITMMFVNSVRGTFALRQMRDGTFAEEAQADQLRIAFSKATAAEVNGDLELARRLYTEIIDNHPNSRFAEDARSCLAVIKQRVN